VVRLKTVQRKARWEAEWREGMAEQLDEEGENAKLVQYQ
jgi:hypothetical protein